MNCMQRCCNTRNDNELMFLLDLNPNEARDFFIVIVYIQNTRQVGQIRQIQYCLMTFDSFVVNVIQKDTLLSLTH